MRLWHYQLIPYISKQRLMGQHRECCALRGKGWGKPHSTVNYVFEHPYEKLFEYHHLVMDQLLYLNVNVNNIWFSPNYRGKALGYDYSGFTFTEIQNENTDWNYSPYLEHNDAYLIECLQLLKERGEDLFDVLSEHISIRLMLTPYV